MHLIGPFEGARDGCLLELIRKANILIDEQKRALDEMVEEL
jgi:hypothetical protein